jgi:hypothetical protein
MNNEIHIYIGSGCIEEKSNYNYPAGERHPFLLYLKADNDSEYNPMEAESTISKLGLNEIEFTKVGKLSTEKINDDEKREHYNNTMKTGSTLIVYSDPV